MTHVPKPVTNSVTNSDDANTVRIALLIDADNLHPSFADEMFAILGELGVVTLRRAYGNFGKPEVQKWHAAMRQHAVAPVHQHDLVAGKNATDIRLAIDAIELVVERQCDVLAIASSDSDFSPLAIRLRERGVPVIGFAQRGKTAADLAAAFDSFHLLDRGQATAAEAPPAKRSRRAVRPAPAAEHRPAPSAAAGSPPAAEAAAEPISAATRSRRTVRKPMTAKVSANVSAKVSPELFADLPKAAELPAEIAAILAAVPELRGAGMALNSASEALRRAGILQGRNASPSRLFKKYPEYFQLRPPNKPETVHFAWPHAGRNASIDR